jgi:hypothetical protein
VVEVEVVRLRHKVLFLVLVVLAVAVLVRLVRQTVQQVQQTLVAVAAEQPIVEHQMVVLVVRA